MAAVATAVVIATTDATAISTGGRDGVIWATTFNTFSDGDTVSLGAMPLERLFTLMAEGESFLQTIVEVNKHSLTQLFNSEKKGDTGGACV